MSNSNESPGSIHKQIRNLGPKERHTKLKGLLGSDVFPRLRALLDQNEWAEFMWFEKADELCTKLKSTVPIELIQGLVAKEPENNRSAMRSLLLNWEAEDEVWLFDYLPGDKGYAVVRDGQILDFAVLDVRTATFD